MPFKRVPKVNLASFSLYLFQQSLNEVYITLVFDGLLKPGTGNSSTQPYVHHIISRRPKPVV